MFQSQFNISMTGKKLLAFCGFVFLHTAAIAQFDIDTVMRYSSSLVFKPAINFSGCVSPYRRLVKSPVPNDLNYFQGTGNMFVPLWGKFKYSEDYEKPTIIQLSGNLGGAYTRLGSRNPDFDFSHPLINLNAGLNFFWYDGKKSAITTGLFAFTNEDNYTIANPTVRYTGYLQWRYSLNTAVALRLGVTYTFTFGRGIPWPIVGINWRLRPKVILNLNFPFNANLNWTPGKQNQIRFFIQQNGGVSTFGNATADLGLKADKVVLRRREYKVGVSFLQYVKGKFNFSAEAGVLVARRITLTTPNRKNDIGAGLNLADKKVFDSKLDPAPYVQLGLGYRFGKALKKKKKIASPDGIGMLEIPANFGEEEILDFGQLDVSSVNLDVQPLNIDAIDKFDLNEDDFKDFIDGDK